MKKIIRKIKQFFHKKRVYSAVIKSGIFDKEWYLKQYPEVLNCADPIEHYLTNGWKEGKEPSEHFHSSRNLCVYPDVWDEIKSPLEYYLLYKNRHERMCFCSAQIGTEKLVKTNHKPLVSVIITSYNYAKFLPETIESILKQTYTNYEIIIVDDGSTDNSIDVINHYLSMYKNISLYVHPNNENRGLPESVRLGVEKSKGDYIAFCESDDVWHSQNLEKRIDIINKYHDVKIVSSNVELFGDEKRMHSVELYVKNISSFLFNGGNNVDVSCNYIPTFSTVVIRKDILQNLDYNSPIPAWIDFWLYRQILNKSYLYYIDEKLVFWRIHESFNCESKSREYVKKRDLFIFKSDQLIGIKVSRRILRKIRILEKSEFFDKSYYLKLYGARLEGLDPITHYFFVGWKKGCNPSPLFSNDAYLASYADVWYSSINPLIHYELYGKKEGRKIYPIDALGKYQLEEFDIEKVKNNKGKIKTILLISHELSLTGAPRALLNMAIILKKIGVMPVILSLRGGGMEKEVTDLGIKLLVDPLLHIKCIQNDQLLFRFCDEFDTIVFNTLDTVRFVQYFSHVNACKICWLHEGSYAYDYWQKTLDLQVSFSYFDKVYAVGEYSKSFADPYILHKDKLGILLYGIPDIEMVPADELLDGQIKFLLPGSLSVRKGQLVLLESLRLLPKEIRKQIKVYIVGGVLEKKVEKAIKHYVHHSCLTYLGELEHERLLTLFSNMHVVLTPSLDDPMPIVCTEAMILKKAIIVSENTGTASFIENGVNGYRVPANNPKALAEAIGKLVSSKNILPELGQAARRIYDDNFAMDTFEKNIKLLIVGN